MAQSVPLLRYNRPVRTIFDLLGNDEDDMTYSLGFVASRSPLFLRSLLKSLGLQADEASDVVIRLQTADVDGRTDVEIVTSSGLVVFEAKRGIAVPTTEQLQTYLPRFKGFPRQHSRLVALTNAPPAHANQLLSSDYRAIRTVPVQHLSWREVRDMVRGARRNERNDVKRIIDDFDQYLTELLCMETIHSNAVFVVSLGTGGPWGLDFKKIVAERRLYFYPAGPRWPSQPPNYLAFRYEGRLQSIHHVDGYELFTNPADVIAGAKSVEVKPHYLCDLGPAIVPAERIENGKRITRASRVWCMLDTLLTCRTISDALTETERRETANREGWIPIGKR